MLEQFKTQLSNENKELLKKYNMNQLVYKNLDRALRNYASGFKSTKNKSKTNKEKLKKIKTNLEKQTSHLRAPPHLENLRSILQGWPKDVEVPECVYRRHFWQR